MLVKIVDSEEYKQYENLEKPKLRSMAYQKMDPRIRRNYKVKRSEEEEQKRIQKSFNKNSKGIKENLEKAIEKRIEEEVKYMNSNKGHTTLMLKQAVKVALLQHN